MSTKDCQGSGSPFPNNRWPGILRKCATRALLK